MEEKPRQVTHYEVKHAADVDLRMVQVAAVAVGREVLRLAGEVDAGRLTPTRAQAVMVACHNVPLEQAREMTSATPKCADILASIPPALAEHYAETWAGALPEERELAATLYARRHYHALLHTRAEVPKLEDCPPMERMDWLEVARTVRAFVRNGLDAITLPKLLSYREQFVVERKDRQSSHGRDLPVRGVRHG